MVSLKLLYRSLRMLDCVKTSIEAYVVIIFTLSSLYTKTDEHQRLLILKVIYYFFNSHFFHTIDIIF